VHGTHRRQGSQGGVDPREKPKGSQCIILLTPLVDQITSRPTSRGAGWKACRTHGVIDGHWCSRACRIAGRAIEVNAFFRSTCNKSHPVLPCKASTWARTPMATNSHGLSLAKAVRSGASAVAAFRPWVVASSHFATSLRRVSPTAIGLTLSSFLHSGIKRAAHR